MKPIHPLHGLVAAAHAPFRSDGSLNLSIIEKQAAHLERAGIASVFINGSTGESHSLSVDERCQIAAEWSRVVRGSSLKLVVHVGANCLGDCKVLAKHAQAHRAIAISSLSPSYFKPRSMDALIACCAEIASAAPETPFYFYDIPKLTGVGFPMTEFLEKAPAKVPTLAGLKFTNPDLMAYVQCLRAEDGRWDIPWGIDEWMLGAVATGAQGAVGSGFNFAAPVYLDLLAAFERGDLESARIAQFRGTQLVALLARYGYMGAAKAIMGMLGVDVGPARLPNTSLDAEETKSLRSELEILGFFDWIQ